MLIKYIYCKMQTNQCFFIQDYTVKYHLGTGGQASVYLCEKDNKLYAAKVYLSNLNNYLNFFNREVELMKKMSFQHLINMVDYNIQAKVNLQGEHIHQAPVIFMEFAQRNRLTEYITAQGPFSPQICRTIYRKLLKTIKYIHSINIAHRDLKTENILFNKNFDLKVADFGMSRDAQGDGKNKILYTKVGTDWCKPPQMTIGQYTGLGADLFASGVLLFYIYTGSIPFMTTRTTDPIYKFIYQKKYDKFWSIHCQKKGEDFFPEHLKKLFQSFFSKTVSERATIEQLEQNQWLNGPQASQTELVTELEGRYKRRLQIDYNQCEIEKIILSHNYQNVQQMEKKLQSKYHEQQSISQSENQLNGINVRTFKQQERKIDYFYHISMEQIQLSNKFDLLSMKISPSKLINILQNFFTQSFDKKNIFLKNSVLKIVPFSYKTRYNEELLLLGIYLTFDILSTGLQNENENEKNEEPYKKDITLQGKLVKFKNNRVSIEWQFMSGNSIWVESILYEVNNYLRNFI